MVPSLLGWKNSIILGTFLVLLRGSGIRACDTSGHSQNNRWKFFRKGTEARTLDGESRSRLARGHWTRSPWLTTALGWSQTGHDCFIPCGPAGNWSFSASCCCAWCVRGSVTPCVSPRIATCWSPRMILAMRPDCTVGGVGL